MSNQGFLHMSFLIGVVLLSGCSSAQRAEQEASRPKSKDNEVSQKDSIPELKRLFQSTNSELARRAICLRAIDETVIRQGGSVSSIDEIFGSHFAAELPSATQAVEEKVFLFAQQWTKPPMRLGGLVGGIGDIGWYLVVGYDHKGIIQTYYLSNLHKTGSSRVDGKEPMSVKELRHRYEAAKSESERRDVCLLAIDEGVIQTFGPVPVSTIDEIFGTHLASELPTRKEKIRKGQVSFGPLSPEQENRKADVPSGWIMVVEYYRDGTIDNYYLTNIH